MSRPNCIFCKIVSGLAPSVRVLETERVLAFLDIFPVHFGHTVVIPKSHYENFLDLPDDLWLEMSQVSRKVAKALLQVLKAQGFNVAMNNFEAAGQIVFHAHIHVIPRYFGDGLHLLPPEKKKYQGVEMAQVGRQLCEVLASL
ncbi:MAG: HIT family protein [Desulfobaccales bacterium]